jgi:hypothetical protein
MKPSGLVAKLVDFEFKQISLFRLFQSQYSTVWFQHGIIGIWRRGAFTETLEEHPFLPFGEDNWNGTINLLKQRHMAQELRSCVSTYAPSTIFPGTGSREQGYGATNLWKQRAERWCVNAPRRFWIRLYLLFFYQSETFMKSLVFKVVSIVHLCGIVVNLAAPLLVLYALHQWHLPSAWHVLSRFLGYLIFQWLDICIMSNVLLRHRPDLQADLTTIVLWPFYHLFLHVCTIYGHWRCLLWYIPFVPMRHGLYTEGMMDEKSLKKWHNIECSGEQASSQLCC